MQVVQNYNRWGVFPNGKGLDDQDDNLWLQMRIIQRLLEYEKWAAEHPDAVGYPEQNGDGVAEPMGFDLEAL